MDHVYFVALICCVHYASSQYQNPKPLKSPCESSTQNSLVEQFFNIIFTEFYSTPPVCVCVQMCAGQSTYCYPNGCLKRDDLKRVESPQATSQAQSGRNRFMFVVDEKNDFMKESLERTYTDESTILNTAREPMQDKRPELFKDKYSMLVKYKKMPSIKLKYNLREQVKNMKSEQLKLETLDISKTRWPLNKRNLVTGHKSSKVQKRTPLSGKANIFMSMLPANDYAEYSQKNSKRDITRTLNENDTIAKAIFVYDNSDNTTDSNASDAAISLETLIDNLIKNSFNRNPDENKEQNELNASFKGDEKNKTKVVSRTSDIARNNVLSNETVNVISINLTDEKVDKNKYVDDSVTLSTNKFNEMIINLSKRIEKQNNTSLEIAKRVVSDFDELDTTEIFIKKTTSTITENSTIKNKEKSIQDTKLTTSAYFKDNIVTKKNRQRRAKKLQKGKNNSL